MVELIKSGADVHANDDIALRISAEQGLLENVKYLIELGANIHAHNDSALSLSARSGHFEVVKYLIQAGANITADDNAAWRWSAYGGFVDIMDYLISQGVDIHTNNDFALRWSARKGYMDVVEYLIEGGANIHAGDDYALRFSAAQGHYEVAEYLISKGADMHARNDYVKKFSKLYDHLKLEEPSCNSLDVEWMHRINFFGGCSGINTEWIYFNSDLDELIEELQMDYTDHFRTVVRGNGKYHPNELDLKTDGVDKYVISNLFTGYNIWCLTNPSKNWNEMYTICSGKTKILDPFDLTFDEFKEYCKLICTECGEYGHIYLFIQKYNAVTKEYEDVFD